MSADSVIYKCANCDYNSKWKYNVTRHMMVKHTSTKVTDPSTKVTVASTKVTDPSTKVTDPSTKVTDLQNEQNICTDTESKQCQKCNKLYAKRCTMLKHQVTCQGTTNPLQCEFCMKIFAYKSNKSQHKKICKNKENQVFQELILYENKEKSNNNIQTQQQTQPPSQQLITNIQNAENITNNNTINNTTNNVINNIIVFDPVNMELLNDHISKKDIKKMVNNHDFVKVLSDYGQALLGRTENQCVRKTNLRSSSSAVHIGNDKWEYHSDKQILPKLLANIATNFGTMTQDHKITILKQLDDFIVGVTCEGVDYYEDKDEDALLKSQFKSTSNNIKHVLFNITKQQK